MKIVATLFVSIVLALGFASFAEATELLSVKDRNKLLLFVEKDIFQFSERGLISEKDRRTADKIVNTLRSNPPPEMAKEASQNYMDRLLRLKEILKEKGLESPALDLLFSSAVAQYRQEKRS